MRNILNFLIKYHFPIVFIILEFIALSLLVTQNLYQRSSFFGRYTAFIKSKTTVVNNVVSYFHLKEENTELLKENLRLLDEINFLKQEYKLADLDSSANIDSAFLKNDSLILNYTFINARVINSSINKTNNFITIDKGEIDGVTQEMGVCINDKVVGIVAKTSRNYSLVMPLINTNLRVSAKFKKNGHHGSLLWDGVDFKYSYLNDIPFHVKIEKNDTIITSGYSSIFPNGYILGYSSSVTKQNANFLKIKLKLATDFNKLTNVYIIRKNRAEQLKLEKSNEKY